MTDDTTNGASTTEATPPIEPTKEHTHDWTEATAASAEAEKTEPREEKSKPYQDRFLVPMTDEDRARLIVDLGALAADIDVEEAAAKAIAKEHRDSLDEKHKKLRELIRSGREGKIEKTLKVVDHRILSLNVLRIVRLDTGETVFERPLAAGERQADLFPPKKDDPKLVVGVDPAGGPDATVVAKVAEDGQVTVDRGDPVPAAPESATKKSKKGSRKKKA